MNSLCSLIFWWFRVQFCWKNKWFLYSLSLFISVWYLHCCFCLYGSFFSSEYQAGVMKIDPQLDLFQAKMSNRLLLFPGMMEDKIRLSLGGTTCTVWQQESSGLNSYSCLHVLPCLLGSFTVPLSLNIVWTLKLRATLGASVSVYSCIDWYRFLFTTFVSSKLTRHLQLFPSVTHTPARVPRPP